ATTPVAGRAHGTAGANPEGATCGAQEWQGELELPGSKTNERRRHDQERNRPDGLFQQFHHQCRPPEFHLGWSRQQRRAVADGNYAISISGKDASGQVAAVSTEVEGVVDSVDLSQTPPVLSIGGQSFTLDKIKRVVRANS